jgi:hypothetical protein
VHQLTIMMHSNWHCKSGRRAAPKLPPEPRFGVTQDPRDPTCDPFHGLAGTVTLEPRYGLPIRIYVVHKCRLYLYASYEVYQIHRAVPSLTQSAPRSRSENHTNTRRRNGRRGKMDEMDDGIDTPRIKRESPREGESKLERFNFF